jgi:hypothetical protein
MNPGASDTGESVAKGPRTGSRRSGQAACPWQGARKNSSNLNERRGNVYENTGSASRGPERSGHVYDKTGTYVFKARMLLKTMGVCGRS